MDLCPTIPQIGQGGKVRFGRYLTRMHASSVNIHIYACIHSRPPIMYTPDLLASPKEMGSPIIKN